MTARWHFHTQQRGPQGGRPGRADVSPAKEPPDEPGDRVDQDRRDERQSDLDRSEGKSVPSLEQADLPQEVICAASFGGIIGR